MFRSGRRLKEHQPDDQRKQEPETKAPQDGERPTEVAIGGVRAASGRLIHWPSIAYLAVGLAQLAWIYTTVGFFDDDEVVHAFDEEAEAVEAARMMESGGATQITVERLVIRVVQDREELNWRE